MKTTTLSALAIALFGSTALADDLSSIEITNTFAAPGLEMFFAATPATPVADGAEFAPFLLYDIDAGASDVTFTLSDNSINNVGVDPDSADVYYIEFDQPVTAAEVTAAADSFNVEVVVYEADTTLSFPATFDLEKMEPVMNNPELVMENGGIAVRILEGTTLTDDDLGNAFTVSITTAE